MGEIITPEQAAAEAAMLHSPEMAPQVLLLNDICQVMQQHTMLLQSISNQLDLMIRLDVGNKKKAEVFNQLRAWDAQRAAAMAEANGGVVAGEEPVEEPQDEKPIVVLMPESADGDPAED